VSDELKTTDSVDTWLCTVEGAGHDFRPYTYQQYGRQWTSWRCVWCHGVACGNYGAHDPCMRIYHHTEPHQSRSGLEWPIGGTRPDSWAS